MLHLFLLLALTTQQSHQQTCTESGWLLFDYQDIQTPDCAVAEPDRQRPAAQPTDCQSLCRSIATCTGYSWKEGVCYFKRCGRSTHYDATVFSAVTCNYVPTTPTALDWLKCDLAKMISANNNAYFNLEP